MKVNKLPPNYHKIDQLQQRLRHDTESIWQRRGEKRALALFHAMAKRVPAYKDFLKKNNFNPQRVKTITDFTRIPSIDKDSYLRKYPLEMLCWDGDLKGRSWVISTTSGSSGQPFYFPRESEQDLQYAISAELYLRNNFNIHTKSTLYIIAFPMGAWIGGVFTYEALKMVVKNSNYRLSIITPGIHKQEVINTVKRLGDQFDQIIIGAYAPFLKDILDDGIDQGINWASYDIGFIFSAEAFNEKFRDYTLGIIQPHNILKATLNHYGLVDLGTVAHETPESIMIRRHLADNKKLDSLFPEPLKQPTFAQYNPELFYFEERDQSLLCSAYSGLPLVRYDLKDYGGILARTTVHKQLAQYGFDVVEQARDADIYDTLWNLPFVYVYERNDFSVSYYAFLIYPDTIRRILQSNALTTKVTGKFTMLVDYDKSGRQRLYLHIELKNNQISSSNLRRLIKRLIHEGLTTEVSEYRETFRTIGRTVEPIVHLWPYEDVHYFNSKGKQKWVLK